ncbi:MAG: acyl carrier protein [Gammaproteobacteria bacterium]|nr:acyl carrier protein [Gammaproteobacteria bacterium]
MSNTLNQLLQEVAELLNKDSVDADATMMTLGVDSMNVVELIMICEEIYPNAIDPDSMEFDEYTTLRQLDENLRVVVA